MTEQDHRDMRYIMTVVGLLVTIGLFLACSRVEAADLPRGMTCAQVVQAARYLQLHNTRWGRAQARLIALTYGVVLTSNQIEEAAKCLR